MRLHGKETEKLHLGLSETYKKRLGEIEEFDDDEEEKNTSFELSYLHNAIHLHTLWFEQLEDTKEDTESHLLEEILDRRDSDIVTFQRWMNGFANDAKGHGWAIWGWSYPLKTFVGFPVTGHDEGVPFGVVPILVIDCWEHSYQIDFELNFGEYLDKFWREINWTKIEQRHTELAHLLGFNIK